MALEERGITLGLKKSAKIEFEMNFQEYGGTGDSRRNSMIKGPGHMW